MIQENELYRKIADACRWETADAFRLQSRIHRLRWFCRSDIWVKRDDELSFGEGANRVKSLQAVRECRVSSFSHKKWGNSVEIEKFHDIIKRNEIFKANVHRAVKTFL